MEMCVSNIGARIISLMVPDKSGTLQNVVIGHDKIEPYMQLADYFGATIGRYANRIAGAEVTIDRVKYKLRNNEGENILHGGPRGFHTQYFEIEKRGDSKLVAYYMSKAGEEGFPGNLSFTVTYTLTADNALEIEYEANTDRTTLINPTNHSYFNLTGAGATAINDHELFIDATQYTPVNDQLIPTGAIAKLPAELDFSTAKTVEANGFYDHNYVLSNPGNIENVAAKLVSNTSGITMEVYTTEPGMQFYRYGEKPSVCLETQHFPDSPNHPTFPSTLLTADEVFASKTIYKFGVKN